MAQRKWILAGIIAILLSGCAGNPSNTVDPYELVNRKIFKFNVMLDSTVLRPIAVGYQAITPSILNKGITNFFHNLHELSNIANDALQGKFFFALSDAWRFVINSTVGIGGLFDVATPSGLSEHKQDFGVTLARWGYKNSAFIMLPFFGPSTVRDAASMPIDHYALSYWPYIDDDTTYYSLYALKSIDYRASLLPADQLIRQSFDPYVFVRNAYLQKRRYLLNKRLEHEFFDSEHPNPAVPQARGTTTEANDS